MDDEELRNIFCDLLGDNMSLIHEYGERKEQKGIAQGIVQGSENIIISFLKSGMSAEEISERIKMPLDEILEIKNKHL